MIQIKPLLSMIGSCCRFTERIRPAQPFPPPQQVPEPEHVFVRTAFRDDSRLFVHRLITTIHHSANFRKVEKRLKPT